MLSQLPTIALPSETTEKLYFGHPLSNAEQRMGRVTGAFDRLYERQTGLSGTDRGNGLQQAANNARTISQFLSGATGQSVFVQPILTLPGWWVDRTVPKSSVWVLNPKEIIGACKDAAPNLTSPAMRAIVYQLERHCKIVQA